MSNATVNLMGTANNASQDDGLFLKVFSGEVLTSYEKATVTAGAEQVRTIANGKSASFPVIGRIGADYHVAGEEITGDNINHAERVITINDLLLSSVFVGNLEEAKLHYDIRGIYSAEMGRALAFQKDKHVLQTILQAAEGTSPLTGDGAVDGMDGGRVVVVPRPLHRTARVCVPLAQPEPLALLLQEGNGIL